MDNLKTINNQYVAAYDFAGDILSLDDIEKARKNYNTAAQLDPKNIKKYKSKISALKTNNGRKYIATRRFSLIDRGV